jgi:hypothetical protein
MQPTRSLVPVAKKFIMKAKLKAPIKRWNDQLLVQLRGFMTEKAKRVQEVDLRKVARQLNIKYTQQNQPEPQQNQPEPQQNQPEPQQNQPEPPQQQEIMFNIIRDELIQAV